MGVGNGRIKGAPFLCFIHLDDVTTLNSSSSWFKWPRSGLPSISTTAVLLQMMTRAKLLCLHHCTIWWHTVNEGHSVDIDNGRNSAGICNNDEDPQLSLYIVGICSNSKMYFKTSPASHLTSYVLISAYLHCREKLSLMQAPSHSDIACNRSMY